MDEALDSRPAGRPRVTAAPGSGHPFHALLAGFPIAFFTAALVTDITYSRTYDLMWSNFSAWLILAGLVTFGLAAVAGIVAWLGDRSVRGGRTRWHSILTASVFVIEVVNFMVHMGDGWTAVVPWGVILSAIAVLLLLVAAWLGGHIVHRQRVETVS